MAQKTLVFIIVSISVSSCSFVVLDFWLRVQSTEGDLMKQMDEEKPYWVDRVYHYVSRRYHEAMETAEKSEAGQWSIIIQDFVNGTVSEEDYGKLEDEEMADRRQRKRMRKKKRKGVKLPIYRSELKPTVNVTELKRRIFDHNVSVPNVIKALESLPTKERKELIEHMSPGLKKKLGSHLK